MQQTKYINYVKDENYFLINNILILDNDTLPIIIRLKNVKSESFIFSEK